MHLAGQDMALLSMVLCCTALCYPVLCRAALKLCYFGGVHARPIEAASCLSYSHACRCS